MSTAYDGRHKGPDIVATAAFGARVVAIATESDVIAIDGIDAMENEMALCDFSQDHIAHTALERIAARENDAVAVALDERAHAIAPSRDGDRVTFVDLLADDRKKFGVV